MKRDCLTFDVPRHIAKEKRLSPYARNAAATRQQLVNDLLNEIHRDASPLSRLPPWEAEAILERKAKVEELESFFEKSLEPKTLTNGSPAAPAGNQPLTNSGQQKGCVMSLTFEIKAGSGVPAGFYRAKFETVEETLHDEYGAGLKFVFKVVDGEQKDGMATRITSPAPTPKNAAGRMIAGITGTALVPGAKIDLAPYVGKTYLLQVEAVANGNGTRIGTIMPEAVK